MSQGGWLVRLWEEAEGPAAGEVPKGWYEIDLRTKSCIQHCCFYMTAIFEYLINEMYYCCLLNTRGHSFK